MDLEWDEEKRRTNLAKHGVDFEAIVRFFEGPTFERIDERRAYSEDRIIATGVVAEEELTVVYTWRGNSRRVISARRAHPNERRAYRAAYPLSS